MSSPAALVAVTSTRIAWPTSASGQVVGARRWRRRCRCSWSRRRRSAATGSRSRAGACRSRCRRPRSACGRRRRCRRWPGRVTETGGAASIGPTVVDGTEVCSPLSPVTIDAHGRADVVGAERVRLVRGAGDVGAVGAGGVAALPLVGEVDRAGAGPRAGVGGQRLAVDRRAGGRRGRRRSRAGRPPRSALGAEVAVVLAGGVGRGDLDAIAWPTSARGEVVGRAGGAGDVGAVRAVGSQRCHWYVVVDRGGAGPGAGRRAQRRAVLERAADDRDGRVDRRRGLGGRRSGPSRSDALPPTLVAVTATWMTWSMSPGTSV